MWCKTYYDEVKRFPDSVHNNFVIMPTIKANSDKAKISKSFYRRVLIKELSIDKKVKRKQYSRKKYSYTGVNGTDFR